MATSIWALWQDTVSGDTLLQRITKRGAVWTEETPITCPDKLTNANVSTLFMSTAILKSWPQDRNIVYFAGRSDTDGHMKAWRYNDHDGTFTQLLDVNPTSGTWPFATGMWPSRTGTERCYLVTGNGSGWGIFNSQNLDGAQGVWLSTAGGAFGSAGAGRELAYSNSNINHVNSLMTILVDEGEAGDVLSVTHSATVDFSNPPNSYPHWNIVGVSNNGGATWTDQHHPTGLRFLAPWVAFLSPSFLGAYLVCNGSSTGPYSFSNQNFGTLPPYGAGATTGIGPYGSNCACLPFEDADTLLAFYTNVGQIDIHSPITGSVTSTVTNAGWSSFSPTACAVMPTGGAAVGLCEGNISPTAVVLSEDYGSTWTSHFIADRAGLGVDFAEATEPPPALAWPQAFSWRDSRGFTGITRFHVSGTNQTDARANAIIILGYLLPVTNASFAGAHGAWTSVASDVTNGSDDTYNNIETRVRFTFLTDTAGVVQIEVPCPKESIFLDDQEALNLLDPDVSDIAANLVISGLCNRGGMLATQFLGGGRVEGPIRTKFNAGVLNPEETGPGGG